MATKLIKPWRAVFKITLHFIYCTHTARPGPWLNHRQWQSLTLYQWISIYNRHLVQNVRWAQGVSSLKIELSDGQIKSFFSAAAGDLALFICSISDRSLWFHHVKNSNLKVQKFVQVPWVNIPCYCRHHLKVNKSKGNKTEIWGCRSYFALRPCVFEASCQLMPHHHHEVHSGFANYLCVMTKWHYTTL